LRFANAAPPKKLSNCASIEIVTTGDERLSHLYDTHEDKLYRLARRLTASASDAEDLLQDTFLKAAQAIGSIPVGCPNEEAWLTRVLVNTQRDRWRRKAVRQRAAPVLRADSATLPSSAESALIAREAVWSALDALRPRQRAIVILAEIDGQPPDAIARTLGLTVMTVRWHLSMARRALRRSLADFMER
jgi:RNA polymerase sigma-70 factor (ECF subfamily)